MKRTQAWFSLIPAALLIAMNTATVSAQQRQTACGQIRAACEQAGFTQGGVKQGQGLQVDCIQPIMQGTPQRRRAAKPLPQVDSQVIETCKAQNPSFGQGNARRNEPAGAASPPPAAPPTGAPAPQ
jgi:hypothetical protein